MEGLPGYGAGNACHGVLTALPAVVHRSQSGYYVTQLCDRLHTRHLGGYDLPAAHVLRLGWLAGDQVAWLLASGSLDQA